jgi:hypothetical protein
MWHADILQYWQLWTPEQRSRAQVFLAIYDRCCRKCWPLKCGCVIDTCMGRTSVAASFLSSRAREACVQALAVCMLRSLTFTLTWLDCLAANARFQTCSDSMRLRVRDDLVSLCVRPASEMPCASELRARDQRQTSGRAGDSFRRETSSRHGTSRGLQPAASMEPAASVETAASEEPAASLELCGTAGASFRREASSRCGNRHRDRIQLRVWSQRQSCSQQQARSQLQVWSQRHSWN